MFKCSSKHVSKRVSGPVSKRASERASKRVLKNRSNLITGHMFSCKSKHMSKRMRQLDDFADEEEEGEEVATAMEAEWGAAEREHGTPGAPTASPMEAEWGGSEPATPHAPTASPMAKWWSTPSEEPAVAAPATGTGTAFPSLRCRLLNGRR